MTKGKCSTCQKVYEWRLNPLLRDAACPSCGSALERTSHLTGLPVERSRPKMRRRSTKARRTSRRRGSSGQLLPVLGASSYVEPEPPPERPSIFAGYSPMPLNGRTVRAGAGVD